MSENEPGSENLNFTGNQIEQLCCDTRNSVPRGKRRFNLSLEWRRNCFVSGHAYTQAQPMCIDGNMRAILPTPKLILIPVGQFRHVWTMRGCWFWWTLMFFFRGVKLRLLKLLVRSCSLHGNR